LRCLLASFRRGALWLSIPFKHCGQSKT